MNRARPWSIHVPRPESLKWMCEGVAAGNPTTGDLFMCQRRKGHEGPCCPYRDKTMSSKKWMKK